MGVLLGHASLNEFKKTKGGKPGDQTGGEVCICLWYNKPWSVLLRPTPEIAEVLANACETLCKNDNVGYDQNGRNSLYFKLKALGFDLSRLTEPCDTDCSAFMTCCAICAGVTELNYTTNAPTTSTMVDAFTRTKKFMKITEPKYLTTDKYLKRGDILVKPGSHTVMVLSNGERMSV